MPESQNSSPHNQLGDVTRLLVAARDGDRQAFDAVLPAVYDELRRLAARYARRELAAATVTPTALVHEAYLKLVDNARVDWKSRSHFMAVAARAMRQVLVDHARRRRAEKRGGDLRRTSMPDVAAPAPSTLDEVVALGDALDRLDAVDPRLRAVVECRYFGEMSDDEIASALDVSSRTVQRDWVRARAWLQVAMSAGSEGSP